MNDFVNIEILGTMAGCSLIITLLTQIFKKYLPEQVDTKWLALIFSIIIGVLRVFYIRQFDFDGIVSGVFNIFVLLSASIGMYEIGNPVAKDVKTLLEGGNNNEKETRG